MHAEHTTRAPHTQPLIRGRGSVAVEGFDDVHLMWSDVGLVRVSFDAFEAHDAGEPCKVPAIYADPLTAYFEGTRVDFQSVPLDLRGTEFQIAVWQALTRIAYGAVRSYGAIANDVGSPRGMRAVGVANGLNPIPIIVPCHRVVESTMKLGGFSAGLWRKRKLLALEGVGVENDVVYPGQLSLI